MKIKKLFAIICSVALLCSVIQIPAMAMELSDSGVQEAAYLFSDEFGAENDLDGWALVGTPSDTKYVKTVVDPEEESNYLLEHAVASDAFSTYIKKEITPIVFEEGKDVVIETKVKQSGISFIKYNLVRDPGWSEWNNNWGNLLWNVNGAVRVPNGYGASGGINFTDVLSGATDKWLDIKITIHGNTKKASYVIKDLSTSPATEYTINNTDIDHTDSANWVENSLNSLEFTLRDGAKIYVDYVRVYQEKDVVMTTDARCAFDENITVSFDAPYEQYHNIVNLFDAQGYEVEAQKSLSADKKSVTFDPLEDLIPGETYRFVLDTSNAPVNYTFDSSEVLFSVLTVKPPKAENIEIEGRVVVGNKIVADYDYICDAQEGPSVLEWYMADSADGAWTKLDDELAKELEITEATFGKYIKFKVTPYASLEDGEPLDGVGGESNIIAPERAPVAENLTFSAQIPYIDSYLDVTYNYYDENGDDESGTEILWYEGATAGGPWTYIGSGKTYYITEAQNGKYIRCVVTPANTADVYPSGTPAEIVSAGPVTDIITATNKFVNGGLESGQLSPWAKKEGNAVSADYKGITLVTDLNGIYSGSYALRSHPRIGTNTNDVFMQNVTLESNRMYIASAMVKSATGTEYVNVEPYVHLGPEAQQRPYRDAEYTKVGTEWIRSTVSFIGLIDGSYPIGWVSFTNPDADLYVDDMYVGELLISDIKTNEIEPVTIPKTGEKAAVVSVLTTKDGVMLNQFGETDGLTEQKAVVSVPETDGVTVKDNVIYIDSNASAGNITVSIKCVPVFKTVSTATGETVSATPTQSEFVKTLELSLIAHDDKTPVAKDVKAEGIVKTGETLTGTYKFYQVDNKADNSVVKWMYSDTPNGVYQDIPNATTNTYVVTDTYADKYIKFVVLPKTVDGLTGAQTQSEWLLKPTAPVANNITVAGDFKIGGTVTASYEFDDVNKDTQDEGKYQWYVSDYENGTYTQIPEETNKTLVLTESLTDKYIKVGVTPVSTADPKVGTETLSRAYIGPVAPIAKNVTMTFSNNTLTGNYSYFHEHGAVETATTYSWKVDGSVVSTKASYVVNFTGTKSVTFTVTPVGDTNPSTGKPVSVTVSITGNVGNGGTGGSIGGGSVGGGSVGGGATGGGSSSGGGASSGIGSSTGVGITGINDMVISQETETVTTDISGHWGSYYIKEMEKRQVMSADEEGNFNPDGLVSREDMLTYLFKALKLEATDYSGMFDDVQDGAFAGMLQTMVDNGTIAVDTSFRPNDCISREEMCKILYISLENAGKLGEVQEGLINSFSDCSDVSDWAVKYVNAIYGKKIMIGVSDDRFAPKENLTKAQAATLLVRILSLTEEAE